MFKKLFNGRYGIHTTSIVLVYISAAIILLSVFMPLAFNRISAITTAILLTAYAVYRCFSKNVYKRQMEEQAYAYMVRLVWSKIKNLWYKLKVGVLKLFGKSPKAHRRKNVVEVEGRMILTCGYCGGQLRVPTGKGTLRITCPHCKREFTEKT